ncbi:hypothetical protein Tco_1015043 [Tanacetum coccineum]|uniref:Uncharacterized protein n=1 Tax=Tanacetum coccineum TaxID=301880 RepID=A0ABQ5FKQ1_9ASTR
MMSLHNFPAFIFPDDDIEESTSRWVDKCVKKFNPYARYTIEHWKNPHAKIFYIKKQKETEKPKEVNSNGSIVSITESDYKNLNKNDIEDLYLLIVNGKSLGRIESYNNNVKHGYVTPSLSKEDVEYLQLFVEEIEEWLKHHDQMRCWEMYMNGRPLGLRRERPE